MPGTGIAHHFAYELLKLQTGIDFSAVPYSGTGPMLTAIMAGHVQAGFAAVPSVVGAFESKRAKVIAVSGTTRVQSMPSVPTMRESGHPDFDMSEWYGLVAPAGTSAASVARMNQEINKILDSEDLQHWLSENAIQRPEKKSPSDFRIFMKDESAKLARIVKDAKITDIDNK